MAANRPAGNRDYRCPRIRMWLARKPRRTMRYLAFEPAERPISAQLFGADPEVMANAARACQDLGFDIVDLNFGCPVNKVVRCNGGSALLRDLPRLMSIGGEIMRHGMITAKN